MHNGSVSLTHTQSAGKAVFSASRDERNPLPGAVTPARIRIPQMPDHFAALSQPRRPWLDPDSLKDVFHRLAAQHHPDATHGAGDDARFAALNAAHAILREPASRLRHLLELEAPSAPARAAEIPPPLADLFMAVAGPHRALDAFLKKEAASASPIARALLSSEKIAIRRALESTLADLGAAEATALDELRARDATWSARPPGTMEALATLQSALAFLAKWTGQVREDLFRLGV
jgi:curved DNA-binding protein CbpA